MTEKAKKELEPQMSQSVTSKEGEHGAADVGIVGKDILTEASADVYEEQEQDE